MKTLGDTLKCAREKKELRLRKVAAEVDIDQSLISKFEKNERKPTMEQIVRLAKFYGLSESELIIDWYSEKIAEDLKYTEYTAEILKVAEEKINYYKDLRGGDSVYSVYMTLDLEPEYFSEKCTGHFFYTPSKKGLSAVDKTAVNEFLAKKTVDPNDTELKEKLINYLKEYCDFNTLEIAIPALRDPAMAPKGKTGVVVMLLYDYLVAKKIDDAGWTAEIKEILEQQLIKILDETIFPGFKEKVSHRFSSSPLTIEKLTESTEGGITGWAFTNPYMPVVNKMLSVAKSVNTILPNVYQAGQWSFSPAGMPISVLTGKLAADKVIKNSRKKR